MRTLAERTFKRPTAFLPTGCGGRRTGWLIPDELAHVDFRCCCDRHDLAYHIGGFWGLWWRRPVADVALGACIIRAYTRAARYHWRAGGLCRAEAVGLVVVGAVLGPVYTAIVIAVGWVPVIWPWRRRPVPTDAELSALVRRLRSHHHGERGG